MKHTNLLIALCVLFSFSVFAQSTTTVEKNAKRITITTKKTDENGKVISETYIVEGDEPTKILEGMDVDPSIIQRVDITDENSQKEGEQIFMFRRAGEQGEDVTIRTYKDEHKKSVNEENGDVERVIIINKSNNTNESVNTTRECYKTALAHDGPSVFARGPGTESKTNCAALGVLVYDNGQSSGSRINHLIEKGGAQDAGLKTGDVIVRIDEFDVVDFASLHLALSHFKPGEFVTVRYMRDGEKKKSKVELKDWAELPGHEWRSRSDCGNAKTEEVKLLETRDDPPALSNLETLELQDALIYPNPTQGVFEFSFTTLPGPVEIAITDVNGKVVYTDNNENPHGDYRKEIDLKGLPQGNYILSVTQGDRIFTEQISKQ